MFMLYIFNSTPIKTKYWIFKNLCVPESLPNGDALYDHGVVLREVLHDLGVPGEQLVERLATNLNKPMVTIGQQ